MFSPFLLVYEERFANHNISPQNSIFFIISALTELALGRHRKKEQRFGPSPRNNYTSGYGRGGFGRLFRRRANTDQGAFADPNALPAHTTPDQIRQSHQTEETYVPSGTDTYSHSYPPKQGEAGYTEHGIPPASAAVAPAPMTNGVTTNGAHYGNANTAVPQYGASYRYGDGTYNV